MANADALACSEEAGCADVDSLFYKSLSHTRIATLSSFLQAFTDSDRRKVKEVLSVERCGTNFARLAAARECGSEDGHIAEASLVSAREQGDSHLVDIFLKVMMEYFLILSQRQSKKEKLGLIAPTVTSCESLRLEFGDRLKKLQESHPHNEPYDNVAVNNSDVDPAAKECSDSAEATILEQLNVLGHDVIFSPSNTMTQYHGMVLRLTEKEQKRFWLKMDIPSFSIDLDHLSSAGECPALEHYISEASLASTQHSGDTNLVVFIKNVLRAVFSVFIEKRLTVKAHLLQRLLECDVNLQEKFGNAVTNLRTSHLVSRERVGETAERPATNSEVNRMEEDLPHLHYPLWKALNESTYYNNMSLPWPKNQNNLSAGNAAPQIPFVHRGCRQLLVDLPREALLANEEICSRRPLLSASSGPHRYQQAQARSTLCKQVEQGNIECRQEFEGSLSSELISCEHINSSPEKERSVLAELLRAAKVKTPVQELTLSLSLSLSGSF